MFLMATQPSGADLAWCGGRCASTVVWQARQGFGGQGLSQQCQDSLNCSSGQLWGGLGLAAVIQERGKVLPGRGNRGPCWAFRAEARCCMDSKADTLVGGGVGEAKVRKATFRKLENVRIPQEVVTADLTCTVLKGWSLEETWRYWQDLKWPPSK